ncbi:MAG: DoxX family membrane protein [Ignavibacteriales bacterium]|nr:DoxX family membrane protein [Ignavibacteriales bacterium]
MNLIFENKYILLLSRFILGVVFIVASIEKIALPEAFALDVQAYKLVPFPIVNIVALVLPWLELIAGIFMISGVFIRSSSLILISLLCVFIISMAVVLFQGLKIDCGCFGLTNNSQVSWFRVLEDVFLLILGLYIFFFVRENTPIVDASRTGG